MQGTFNLQRFAYFLFILIGLVIAYLPTVLVEYVHHDSTRFWERLPGTWSVNSLHDFNFVMGRFVGAFILSFVGFSVETLRDLNGIRLFNIIQLSLAGSLLAYWFVKEKYLSPLIALLLTLMIFTLPPFQIMVAWASACFHPFAVLFSLVAGLSLAKVDENHFPQTIIKQSRKIVIGILCFLLALSSYPPAAMFFWVVPTSIFLFDQKPWQNKVKKINFFILIGGIVMGIYRLLLKATESIAQEFQGGIYDVDPWSTNYAVKLEWFIREPLYNSMNLWNIFPSWEILLGLGMVALWMCWVKFKQRKLNKSTFFWIVFYSILFLLLSFIPNLIAKGNAPFYRCCVGLTSVVLLLVFKMIQSIAKHYDQSNKALLRWVCVLGCLTGIGFAFGNTLHYRALPSLKEMTFLQHELAPTDWEDYDRVYIIRNRIEQDQYRYDEFVAPTNIFSQNIKNLMICALRELKIYNFNKLEIVSSPPTKLNNQWLNDPRTKVIDFNRLSATGQTF